MLYIGIDLGTSAVKLLLVDETGQIVNAVTKEYPVFYPRPGWSEQNPDDWWSACTAGIRELTAGTDMDEIRGIGAAGQMHGLVILDKNDVVIRPAILWNDSRTEEEVWYLNHIVGEDKIADYTANAAFAGFTAPKLLWMKKNEPWNFDKICRIMLPKDYINYKLTGVHSCDYSDASGTLLLDTRKKCWSKEMLQICEIYECQLPKLYESFEVIGSLCHKAAKECRLSEKIKVVAGAGDNAAAGIGTGTTGEGKCNISLGTSGTVLISSGDCRMDPGHAIHTFAHADGTYHLLGCMLSAASCNTWICDTILHTSDYAAEQRRIPENILGKNHVYFLPYLMGERSPVNDSNARGTFTGLTMDTTREALVLAVLEGVAFGIRDSLEVIKSLPLSVTKSTFCGGGAQSPLWQKIFANVLHMPLGMVKTEQGPGYGAAILSMIGCGEYRNVKEAVESLVEITRVIEPDPTLTEQYELQYQKFKKIYPAMKHVFLELRSFAL